MLCISELYIRAKKRSIYYLLRILRMNYKVIQRLKFFLVHIWISKMVAKCVVHMCEWAQRIVKVHISLFKVQEILPNWARWGLPLILALQEA
jgi:hypothetical protein